MLNSRLTQPLRYYISASATPAKQVGRFNLTKIFTCSQSVRQLSRQLKILPEFFTTELLQRFLAHPKLPEYEDYASKETSSMQQRLELMKRLSAPVLVNVLSNPEVLRWLESYLDWLMNVSNEFNSYFNDFSLELLNLDRPDKWFHASSKYDKKTFIYHHGPTNSGKSTSAIEQLKKLGPYQKGIYMAPLRLLAWQYQQKLGNCSLITGQQKQFKNSNLVSCTIEAAPLGQDYEVAVIDQIQMIGESQRGWAWTRAILATKAKRIHLCGDERALGIVHRLVELMGHSLEERKYSRLSKLTLIHKKFRLQDIEHGDCIINFSMKSLIKHRNQINKFMIEKLTNEKNQSEKLLQNNHSTLQELAQPKNRIDLTNNKINKQPIKPLEDQFAKNYSAIIYGKLPPQCRKGQANFFNSRQLPYLVATNAIGMGLNLNINKIVFVSVERPANNGTQPLEEHQIQQIAGRAGRGKQTGYVQCASVDTLKIVEKALEKVNQTYGIQLQKLRDAQSVQQTVVQDNVQQQEVKQAFYSTHLKRFLKPKEQSIKAAAFYFQVDFLILFKLQMEQNFNRKIKNIEIVNYLDTHVRLGSLYFLQQSKSQTYVLNLLQDKKIDQYELYLFYNGLLLSIPSLGTPKFIKMKLQQVHRQYIHQFSQYRKVELPQFIVKLHNQDYADFKYMDQIYEFQYYYNLLETYVWLWGKFQFSFYKIDLAKKIKLSLAKKLNQVLSKNQFVNSEKSQSSAFTKHNRHNNKQNIQLRSTKRPQNDQFKKIIKIVQGKSNNQSQQNKVINKQIQEQSSINLNKGINLSSKKGQLKIIAKSKAELPIQPIQSNMKKTKPFFPKKQHFSSYNKILLVKSSCNSPGSDQIIKNEVIFKKIEWTHSKTRQKFVL